MSHLFLITRGVPRAQSYTWVWTIMSCTQTLSLSLRMTKYVLQRWMMTYYSNAWSCSTVMNHYVPPSGTALHNCLTEEPGICVFVCFKKCLCVSTIDMCVSKSVRVCFKKCLCVSKSVCVFQKVFVCFKNRYVCFKNSQHRNIHQTNVRFSLT